MIDRLLHDEVGDVASKLHTGRSRNDQVATATRLWTMDACGRARRRRPRAAAGRCSSRPSRSRTALMPSYTHLQRAHAGVSVAHWLLSHFWPLERDRARLRRRGRSARRSCRSARARSRDARIPISRVLLKESLGFAGGVAATRIDAVERPRLRRRGAVRADADRARTSRGWPRTSSSTDRASSGSCSSATASRPARSMMPQKRNPDALELARGSAARMLGDLVSLLGALKGLPSELQQGSAGRQARAVRRGRHAAAGAARGRRRARRADASTSRRMEAALVAAR